MASRIAPRCSWLLDSLARWLRMALAPISPVDNVNACAVRTETPQRSWLNVAASLRILTRRALRARLVWLGAFHRGAHLAGACDWPALGAEVHPQAWRQAVIAEDCSRRLWHVFASGQRSQRRRLAILWQRHGE